MNKVLAFTVCMCACVCVCWCVCVCVCVCVCLFPPTLLDIFENTHLLMEDCPRFGCVPDGNGHQNPIPGTQIRLDELKMNIHIC